MECNPLLNIDFYKVGHVLQYPKGIRRVWSNWTPRTSRTSMKLVRHVGMRYFIEEYLIKRMNQHFFQNRDAIKDYREIIQATLGTKNPYTAHMEELWNARYLPIAIYSLPEGTAVPLGVPSVVIQNTAPWAFWLPNYLETMMSNILWKPSTSATTAEVFRKLFVHWAREAGEKDLSFVDWQGHDFSYRGMSGTEDACLSGLGHLLSFSGTDTLPAILFAKKYYNAPLSCGGSVNATEHSVMSAGLQSGEQETFRRLIEDVYPTGIISVVSDTWDLWKVLTVYVPALKEKILARSGKIVIRPDSGDPVKIMRGDPNSNSYEEKQGAVRLLAQALGTVSNPNGGFLPMINNGGLIYGDGISPERADQILEGVVTEAKLSPFNIVFGLGSYTYQYVTRDTYGFAMKATAFEDPSGNVVPIFKDPVTDNGGKRSHKGIPIVHRTNEGDLICTVTDNPAELASSCMQPVFHNGEHLSVTKEDFYTICKRVKCS